MSTISHETRMLLRTAKEHSEESDSHAFHARGRHAASGDMPFEARISARLAGVTLGKAYVSHGL